MKLIQIDGNGHCLFESFEMIIYGKLYGNQICRQKNAEYITACSKKVDFFKKYIEQTGKTLQQYLTEKSKDAWVDIIDIYALSELYQR